MNDWDIIDFLVNRCGPCQLDAHDHCRGEWTPSICDCPYPECMSRRGPDSSGSYRQFTLI